jgi:hypothetical protein
MPFRTLGGMILVSPTLHGSQRPMNFILDSGAGASVLSKATAKELGLSLTKGERVRTVDGTERADRSETIHFNMGPPSSGLRFSAAPLVIDLTRESRTLGTSIDGLIGADFFTGRSVKIDFKRSRLHVSPTGRPGPAAIRLPLSRGRDGIFVSLTAGDSSLRRVRLDTGCSRSLCWSPPAGSALRGSRNGKTVKTDVNLGSLVVSDVHTDLYRHPLFPGEDGLLGTALLSRFETVWIDSVNHRISFESIRN